MKFLNEVNLPSPDLTGVPTAPTAAVATNTTQIATTAFVNAEISNDAAPISHVGSTGNSHGAATTLVDGFMTTSDKTKLNGIEALAEVNQNAFSTISVSGQNNVVADSKTDTLTFIAGANVIITTDASGDSITIASTGTGGETSTYTASNGVTIVGLDIQHADTSTQTSVDNSSNTYIQDITLDGFGHITNISSATVVESNSFANIAVSGQTTIAADAVSDTLTVASGTGISITTDGSTDTLTISHSDTSTQASLTALTGANVVSDIDVDGFGHVTSLSTRALAAGDIGAATTAAVDLKLDKTTFEKIGRFGFLNLTETTIAFDGVNTFTLAPTATLWSYFRNGKLNTISGSKTITLTGAPPAATGRYFIFIDDDNGNLSISLSPWSLLDNKVTVSTIQWDDTQTPKFLLAEERHTCLIDRRMHLYEHMTSGTQFISGGELSGYILNNSTDSNKTFGITATTIADEDLFETLPIFNDPDGTTPSYLNVYRTSSTVWKWDLSPMAFKYTTTGFIQYDNNGTMTPISNNRYANTYLLATNVQGDGRYFIISGRSNFANLTAALAENFASFDMTGFSVIEAVALYKLTWRGVTGAGLGQCQLTSITRVYANIVSTSYSSSVSHNGLADLQGGASGEYYHLNSTDYTDLTDAGDSILHYHSSDRDRSNHTGTQSADTITDGTLNKVYTAAEQTKLSGIASGAEVNVNADWNAVVGDAVILNKPTSLPASGGDADTVDGKHASFFIAMSIALS